MVKREREIPASAQAGMIITYLFGLTLDNGWIPFCRSYMPSCLTRYSSSHDQPAERPHWHTRSTDRWMKVLMQYLC